MAGNAPLAWAAVQLPAYHCSYKVTLPVGTAVTTDLLAPMGSRALFSSTIPEMNSESGQRIQQQGRSSTGHKHRKNPMEGFFVTK